MKKYNLFLDDIREPHLCLNYLTNYMPQNRRIYSMEDWVVVRNYEEFKNKILEEYENGNFPGVVSFDHDLALEHYEVVENGLYLSTSEFKTTEKTGNDCAKFLVDFCLEKNLDLPVYYIHSANPTGRERIYQSLQDYFRFKNKFGNGKEN